MKTILLFAIGVVFLQVCSVEAKVRAITSLSCQGRCDEYYDSGNTCQCNDQCLKYGNCCDDFIPVCASEDSCGLRCQERYNSSFSCHCNDNCHISGDCCQDYNATCVTIITSCNDRCGESSKPTNANCYCDSGCSNFGNCCDDYAGICNADSCENRCDESSKPSSSNCHCDSACVDYGNCCNDFNEFCYSGERFLCKGECNVTRPRCNCTSDCLESLSCCSDYQETCLQEPTWVEEECATAEEMKCPEGFNEPPVILFSIDGFKAEYIYRQLNPNIWKMATCGVHAPYMRSVYPTKTFPNHHSIATGLYPESHGIIDNRMYDHAMQEEFRLGSKEAYNPAWWGGEPIWVTNSNQGKISATYFWPGTDVNITRYPEYYYVYDGNVPNEERMYQALDWLDLPPDKRPSFMTLYMDNVDHIGHSVGTTEEVNPELVIADEMIGILMNGLRLRGLENCVNIVILADHGMAPISCDRKVSVEDYGVDASKAYIRSGAFGRIGKSKNSNLWKDFDAEKIHDMLRCTHNSSHWQSFLKHKYLPKRYHYANNDRIEPVLLTMDDTWLVEGAKGSYSSCNGGTHGFDNEYRSMHALFVAHGPGFKRSFNTTEPFENIEVYNMLADLLNLNPAPNNGTLGSLNHILKNPTPLLALPDLPVPDQCIYPETNVADSTFSCTYCQGLSESNANKRLNLDENAASKSKKLNMLFGRPQFLPAGQGIQVDDVKYCLLTQTDYVTAYDHIKKLPIYVSYTLETKKRDLLSLGSCSRPDIRVPVDAMTSCSDYMQTPGIAAAFLYPRELSNGDATHDAAITSNQVPMYPATVTIWNYMTRVLANWSTSLGGINVISGPAFDYDIDGHADTNKILRESGKFLTSQDTSAPIPTHFFMIIMKCHTNGEIINDCMNSLADLEVLSFIIPNYEVEPCHEIGQELEEWIPGTLLEHVARVRDIELLTGLSFLASWSHSAASREEDLVSALRMKLRLPQFTSEWLTDFLTPGDAGGDAGGDGGGVDGGGGDGGGGGGGVRSLHAGSHQCLMLIVSLICYALFSQ